MGQKLNCCERKDVDHQELRKEEGNQSDKLIKETEKPFVKSAHSPNQETNDFITNPTMQKETERITTEQIQITIPQDKIERSAINIQKVAKGKLYRKKFDAIKEDLINEQQEYLKASMNNIEQLKESKVELEDENFDRAKWKSYYPDSSNTADFFNPSFGKVFDNEILISQSAINGNAPEIYKGSININNQKHGYGVLATKDVTKIGTWINDSFTGWNKEKFSNGSVLEGKFINGSLNGKGIASKSDVEYEGDFRESKFEGKGKLTYKDTGETYEGDFKDNTLTGYGKFTWPNGEVYEGEFLNGKFNGKGKYSYPDGQIYEGDYVNGVKEGNGKLTFPSGRIYEGPFVNGLQDGIGKYTKRGKTVNVLYEKGKFIKVVN